MEHILITKWLGASSEAHCEYPIDDREIENSELRTKVTIDVILLRLSKNRKEGAKMPHRILQSASDKYNLDLTIKLDYEPEGFDYQMILYDARNRLLGVAKDNDSGGKSITIPKWCMQDGAYKLKVQTRDGPEVISEEDYNLVFEENTLQGTYMQMCQKLKFNFALQKKLNQKYYSYSQRGSPQSTFHRCEECYMGQMEVFSQTKEFYA